VTSLGGGFLSKSQSDRDFAKRKQTENNKALEPITSGLSLEDPSSFDMMAGQTSESHDLKTFRNPTIVITSKAKAPLELVPPE